MGLSVFSLILCTIALVMDACTLIDGIIDRQTHKIIASVFFIIMMIICIGLNITKINSYMDKTGEISVSDSVKK